jgi:hypothetical protein
MVGVAPTTGQQAAPGTVAAGAASATGTVFAPGPQADTMGLRAPGRSGPRGPSPDGRRPRSGISLFSGRLARLRIGSHLVSRPALAQLTMASVGAGLLIGADRHEAPVSVRVFRPEATRLAVVGRLWTGRMLAFRAFAVGARVVVITSSPSAWQEFGYRATGSQDRVLTLEPQQPLTLVGTPQQPVLVVDELGVTPQPLAPWQTQVTVLRQAEPTGLPLLQESDLVVLQRMRAEEAEMVGKALRLRAASVRYLQVMPEDMVSLVAQSAEYYVTLSQTDVEREYTGSPRS